MKKETEAFTRALARQALTPKLKDQMLIFLQSGATYEQFRAEVGKVLNANTESRAAIQTIQSAGMDPESLIKIWFEEISLLVVN
jgi:hypothetical protein